MSGLDAALLVRLGDAAARYAAEGGRLALDGFPLSSAVEFKDEGQTNPVTDLDKAIERRLRAAIAADFPDHAVVGEEEEPSGATEANVVWAIDPLDGTRNFINGVPLFAVSVAALWRGRPVAGALFTTIGPRPEPVLLRGRLGGGAWLGETPLRVAGPALPTSARLVSLPSALWAYLRPGDDLRYADTRSFGSIALELALLSFGALQSSIFGGPRVWDVAAGVLLVQEAGGAVLWRPQGARRWRGFEGFGDARGLLTKPEELRHWRCPLIAGTPAAVTAFATRLPGPAWWQRAWRALSRQVRTRARAHQARHRH